MRGRTSFGLGLIVVLMLPAIGACARSDTAKQDVEDVVRAHYRAERAGDIDTFLALWTDKGLKGLAGPFARERSGADMRAELKNEKSEAAKNFGRGGPRLVSIPEIRVDENRATAVAHAALGPEEALAAILFRAEFQLTKKGEKWLLDGYEPKGSPPVPDGADVVDVRAVDYGFELSKNKVDGDVAFRFSNGGKEGHQLVLVDGPAGVDSGTVVKAFAAVRPEGGPTFESPPRGYEAGFLSETEPGDEQDVVLEKPIASGEYFLVCLRAHGGGGEGPEEPTDPDAKLHVELGMINAISVE